MGFVTANFYNAVLYGRIRAKVSQTFRPLVALEAKSYYSNQFLPSSNTQAV